MATAKHKNKMPAWWYRWLRREPGYSVKVYHGYGDEDALLVYGHVFSRAPLPRKRYRRNVVTNTIALFRMFSANAVAGVPVKLQWGRQVIEAVTDKDGFFKLEWTSQQPLQRGWNMITVEAAIPGDGIVSGEGKILVPHHTQYAYISDIDDTFLVSHSSKMGKRLQVLFTKNARTRKPFEGVVNHYRLLAKAHVADGIENPFFYVSSSEWNLYEYIKEFCRSYEMPEGVFLLSPLKQWYELLKTGQGKHTGKFMRIARLLIEFPHRQFVLMGDDTQQDPDIYYKITQAFPGRIKAIYWRNIRKSRKERVGQLAQELTTAGIEVCYFQHSAEAIAHSQKIGLIAG